MTWESIAKRYLQKRARKRLAAIYKAQLPGGLADDKTPDDFNQEDLKEGAEHEMVHTYDPELATELAMDNLAYDKDYYRKLKESGLMKTESKKMLPTDHDVKVNDKDYFYHWKGGFNP